MTIPLLEHLFVEPGTTCSAACRHCPHALVKDRRQDTYLTPELIAKTIENLKDLKHITLVGLGEPFEVPSLLNIVRMLSKRGLAVDSTTNGVHLSRLSARCLDESGIARLSISLDSAIPGLQQILRPKHTVSDILKQIARLHNEMTAIGAHFKLRITLVRTRSTLASLPDTLACLSNVGVREVLIKQLTLLHRALARNESMYPDNQDSIQMLDDLLGHPPLGVAAPLKIVVTLNGLPFSPKAAAYCPYHPRHSAFVSAEGHFFPCYFMGIDGILADQPLHAPTDARTPFPGFPWEACRLCPVFHEQYREYYWNLAGSWEEKQAAWKAASPQGEGV